MWLELAAESGQKDSAEALGDLRKALTETQRAEAHQLAQNWRESRAARAQPPPAAAAAQPPQPQ
jgi:hypothetical protein